MSSSDFISKRYEFICTAAILRTVSLWIFRGGSLNTTTSENQFSETVNSLKIAAAQINSYLFLNEVGWRQNYIKIIELDEISNFIVDKIFVWDHLGFQIYKLTLRFLNFNFLNFSNDLGWRNVLYQSCSAWRDLKFCSWKFSHL